MTFRNNEARRQAILAHIGRYTFSLTPVIQKLFFKKRRCDSVIGAMAKDDLIVARPNAKDGRQGTVIPGNYKYYQLTKATAKQLGVPESRTLPLPPASFDKHLAILWYCCMNASRLNLLTDANLDTLFPKTDELFAKLPSGPYCIELEGDHRLIRVFVPGSTSRTSYHVDSFRAHFEEARDHPVLTHWIKHRRFRYMFLVSDENQGKRLRAEIKSAGYTKTVAVDYIAIPTHETLSNRLASLKEEAEKNVCQTKSSASH